MTQILDTNLCQLSRQSLQSMVIQLRRENNCLKTDLLTHQMLAQKYQSFLNQLFDTQLISDQFQYEMRQQIKLFNDIIHTNKCVIIDKPLPPTSHQLKDKGSEKKTVYVCEWTGCLKKFKYPWNFRRHQTIHSGIIHRCPLHRCGYTYPSAIDLQRHVTKFHPTYRCDKSGRIVQKPKQQVMAAPVVQLYRCDRKHCRYTTRLRSLFHSHITCHQSREKLAKKLIENSVNKSLPIESINGNQSMDLMIETQIPSPQHLNDISNAIAMNLSNEDKMNLNESQIVGSDLSTNSVNCLNQTNTELKNKTIGNLNKKTIKKVVDIKSDDKLNNKMIKMDGKYVCDYDGCDKSYKFKSKLKEHRLSHLDAFKCLYKKCGKSYSSKRNLNRHEKKHNNPINTTKSIQFDGQYQCLVKGCKFRTFFRPLLNTHQLKHQKSKSYAKLNCKPKSLASHRKPMQSNAFVCQWLGCDKGFTNKPHLQLHMKTHQQVTGHRCHVDDCTAVFSTAGILRRHESGHQLRYRCVEPDCGYATGSEPDFQQHQINSHQLVINNDRIVVLDLDLDTD